MRKKYKLSKDAQLKQIELRAAICLRDKYISLRWFTHKLAWKYSKKIELSRIEFWEMVAQEYPELKNEKLEYVIIGNYVKIVNEKKLS